MNSRAMVLGAAAVLALGAGCGGAEQPAVVAEAMRMDPHPAFLHGRVTTVDGETYRGRLRFNGDEEAFWGDYFNGRKDVNPWIAHMQARARPDRGIRFVGFRIGGDGTRIDRPFMARMGDIAKLEARGRDLWVTMKSGTVHHLDRYSADDFADGVRIWDPAHGVLDFAERDVRTIEFESSPRAGSEPPYRLHGTVRTLQGDFTGFLQWGPEASLAMDPLRGADADGDPVSIPFATVRSIERLSRASGRVTLLDGSDVVLFDSREIGAGNRGIFVDDARYGRVLVSWDALEAAAFTPVGAALGDNGPAYGDFPPGRPLAGTVTTRDGRTHAGRIVFDLDESESVETLDAPSDGVDYTLPFDRVQSIVRGRSGGEARGRVAVVLRSGEQLLLEPAGDLGPLNGGILIFAGDDDRAEFVAWDDVARVEFRDPRAQLDPGAASVAAMPSR